MPVVSVRDAHAHLAELAEEHVHVVGPGAVEVDLAAGDRRGGQERGRLDPVGDDAVVHGRERARSTPWIDRSSVPTPVDLGAHAVEEVAEVGDLGLAGRVVDDRGALGEHRGHDDVLGGADARELEQDVGAEELVGAWPRCSRAGARTWRRAPPAP